ncbi:MULTISPECIES: twin-arginine translocase TatA/TatE family subunit [unclassified Brevibacterium]|uniref:twin-arginine translocase TatA/TatE family subunit n=1 Tax=unclassified Brevibacterium TaxID=2614124 RepID=UPI001091BCAD|nr:twin-arginine translocase TatA/TatE family subunit [Brevibacterium sp. S22]TGD33019.1 preprotein translocase subunit TatB [Brevibacterium sp. S22]
MLGINGTEMVILVVVALVVIGPKRLPEYAQKLRDLVRQMRRMAEGAKDSVQRDFGDDFKDVDWQKLDPRQYDPRRIVREALVEEDAAIRESKRHEQTSPELASADSSDTVTGTEAAPTRERSPIERFQAQVDLRDRSTAAPFDSEAT